jgi:hypothetical protein
MSAMMIALLNYHRPLQRLVHPLPDGDGRGAGGGLVFA